jgi:uncharacterized protein YdeI (YjbR/CyaY-like superfamily)
METKQNLPILSFASPKTWEEWLAEHHWASKGLWLKIAKKGATTGTVNYAEALDVALCYGWIDGQKGALDEDFWLQKFTPRGLRSKWSKINRDKATALIERGKMAPAGLAQVDAARADGRWENAYEGQSSATVPDDFRRALEANPMAREFFETLTGSTRYAFLYRLHQVRDPEKRAKRIADYVDRLGSGRTLSS